MPPNCAKPPGKLPTPPPLPLPSRQPPPLIPSRHQANPPKLQRNQLASLHLLHSAFFLLPYPPNPTQSHPIPLKIIPPISPPPHRPAILHPPPSILSPQTLP